MGKTTAVLWSEAPLIAGISLIQLVNGYIGTLIGVRLGSAGVEPLAIGIVTFGFFVGYVIGSLLCDRLIQRTGHIRAFSTFAAIEAISILGLSLYFGVIPWMLLRLLAGFACAGLFIATESWLSAKSTSATRGKVFAIYMVATYLTFGGSQFVLTIAPPTSAILFELAAIVLCIALALVATTRSDQPAPASSDRLKSGELFRAAPVGVVGCLAGGPPAARSSRSCRSTDRPAAFRYSRLRPIWHSRSSEACFSKCQLESSPTGLIVVWLRASARWRFRSLPS